MLNQNDTTGAWLAESFQRYNIDPARGLAYLTAHYKGTVAPPLCIAIAQFLKRREIKGTGWSQLRHLREAVEDFAESLTHTSLQLITEDEIMEWLARWNLSAPKTWNEKRGYVQGLFLFAIKKGWIARSPAASIELRAPDHRVVPEVLQPAHAAALMSWLEINEPEWIPYYAFCLFAGVRPDIGRGEAGRLHDDLIGLPGGLAGRVINDNGFFVRGKKRKSRFVKWDDCGSLRTWLAAYPYHHGLIPRGLSRFQAARRLTAFRALHGLAYDVLRHTGASAMIHVPGASYAAIADRLENSEAMLREHYSGVWDSKRTVALYAIVPAGVGLQLDLGILKTG